MIGLVYKGQVNYITRLEDFADFMEPEVYEAMIRALDEGLIENYREKYEELKKDYETLQEEYDELEDLSDELTECQEQLDDAEQKYELLQQSIKVLIGQFYQRYIEQEDIIPTLEKLV